MCDCCKVKSVLVKVHYHNGAPVISLCPRCDGSVEITTHIMSTEEAGLLEDESTDTAAMVRELIREVTESN